MPDIDVLSVGRVSVDLYAAEQGVGFDGQQTFTKSVGGSPANVAVAAARLGRRAALATKVGDDAFGEYVRRRLAGWGVLTDYVSAEQGGQTPLALAALDPPESPQVAFYRGPAAPDTTLRETDIHEDVIRSCGLLWISQGALALGSTARACMSWLALRARVGHTVLDLDYRAALWPELTTARHAAQTAIALCTVVVGNREECHMALGTDDPDSAADGLLAAGVQLAVVKMGAEGSLWATPDGRWHIAPVPVQVVCGLGAGDAFGGALSHGLLSGWDVERIGRLANAAGSFVSARLTCADAMPSLGDLQEMLSA